jgi:hypothetical protein
LKIALLRTPKTGNPISLPTITLNPTHSYLASIASIAAAMPPVQATNKAQIFSFAEARNAAYPHGFALLPASPGPLGQRDPNIGILAVADGKGTNIMFSLVCLLAVQNRHHLNP